MIDEHTDFRLKFALLVLGRKEIRPPPFASRKYLGQRASAAIGEEGRWTIAVQRNPACPGNVNKLSNVNRYSPRNFCCILRVVHNITPYCYNNKGMNNYSNSSHTSLGYDYKYDVHSGLKGIARFQYIEIFRTLCISRGICGFFGNNRAQDNYKRAFNVN